MKYFPYILIIIPLFSIGLILNSCDLTDSKNSYTLTTKASPEDGGTINPSSGEFSEGEQVTLEAVPNNEWQFVRWEGDWSSNSNPSSVTMNKDYSITAVFAFGGVEDIDGNQYKTISIGDQEWMAENLRVTHYRDGSVISTDLSHDEWIESETGAFTAYPYNNVSGLNSEEEVVMAYGLLYNGHAVNDIRGLCPTGWRVPSDDDWKKLEIYIGLSESEIDNTGPRGESQANTLKSCRQENSPLDGDCATNGHPRWDSDDVQFGTDEFGFSALPGGYNYGDSFLPLGTDGLWWSTSEFNSNNASTQVVRALNSSSGQIYRIGGNMTNGISVRCLRN